MDWHKLARCRDEGLAIDWLNRSETEQLLDCALCPVRQQCLAEAIEQRSTGVVRAGVIIAQRPIAISHA